MGGGVSRRYGNSPAEHRSPPGPGRSLDSVPLPDRPREKLFAKGPSALTDVELAAVILGSGTRQHGVLQLAGQLVERLAELHRSGKHPAGQEHGSGATALFEEIRAIAGIGPAKAAKVAAAFELARRYLDASRIRIGGPEDVLPLVSFIADRKQEHLVCISLNGAHEVITTRTVTVGTLTESLVHPREVFADAIADRAAAVILVHNHPSGNLEPSAADLATSQRLREAGRIVGIEVLDHLIVAGTRYRSAMGDS